MTRLRGVVLGDPGAGKSTHAGELARIYDVPHVSMMTWSGTTLGRRRQSAGG